MLLHHEQRVQTSLANGFLDWNTGWIWSVTNMYHLTEQIIKGYQRSIISQNSTIFKTSSFTKIQPLAGYRESTHAWVMSWVLSMTPLRSRIKSLSCHCWPMVFNRAALEAWLALPDCKTTRTGRCTLWILVDPCGSLWWKHVNDVELHVSANDALTLRTRINMGRWVAPHQVKLYIQHVINRKRMLIADGKIIRWKTHRSSIRWFLAIGCHPTSSTPAERLYDL